MSKRAGAVSGETKACIIQAAREEFLTHGFQGSSLRRICATAGVTTGALYFFFEGKDDLFETILAEITVPFMAYMKAHYAEERELLTKGIEENEAADFEVTQTLIDFYFKNQSTWNILLQHLNHPAVRNFLDEFIEVSTEHYLYLIARSDQGQLRRNPVDQFAVHQFVHMQVDMILTLISHDFIRDEMLKHTKTITIMLRGAFLALLTA